MKREEFVSFDEVAPEHIGIHERLNAWARWVRVRPHGWQVSPMFRLYQSKARQWEMPVIRTPHNVPEALEMEKAVSMLPDKHRTAIRWCYVACGSPVRVCRDLGVSKSGLADLIRVGRVMLMNRGM